VFETFMGLPLHPLVIHAAVVFVPLLILAALAYALVPRLRDRIGWVTVLLAFVAPLIALFAKLSGDAFRARLARIAPHGAPFALIDGHRHFGTLTVYATAALALLALALVLIRRKPPVVNVILIVLVVIASGVAAYYVYRAGDSAARIVWKGY
jgi:Predicted membrane protein (DUF2231)